VPILKAEKVVMAGDPFQLPPTVKSREAEKKGLTVTLLEKCISRHERVRLLRTQYRMHDHIMGFSNAQFYKDQLAAHESVAERRIDDGIGVVEFIDTAGCGFNEAQQDDGESKVNTEEAGVLLKHFETFAAGIDKPFSTAVISPYRGQIQVLGELFAGKANVVVNTIDSFQGQEKDVVYLSLVRSNEKNEIGFLKDYRRMNVAMTRARMKLVVVGDSATLGNDPFYSQFLEYCEKVGSYRTAWEFMY
jgi:superfamily I DNA and/or RNA helicase